MNMLTKREETNFMSIIKSTPTTTENFLEKGWSLSPKKAGGLTSIDDKWNNYSYPLLNWSINFPSNWYIYDKGLVFRDSNNTYWMQDYQVHFSPDKFPEFIKEGTEFIFRGVTIRVIGNEEIKYNKRLNDTKTTGDKTGDLTIDGHSTIREISDSRDNTDIPKGYRNYSITYYILGVANSVNTNDILGVSYSAPDKNDLEIQIFENMIKSLQILNE
ncbi:MAG: hypothetical protein ACD_19C00137G0001 [uncultured bacterium]|nr:MAG: hypothetical protein ACD_19C00137G0001 [uncultured bacterium]